MINTEILQVTGLKEREAEAYLALLELGKGTANQIAQKTGMQRPNCYAVLDSLVRSGFASLLPSEKRIYVPVDPQKLADQLQQKQSVFNTMLPHLRGLYQSSSSKPRLQFYEGTSSLISLYDEVLLEDEYACLFTPQLIDSQFADYMESFCRRVKEKNITARDLIVAKEIPSYYTKYFAGLNQEVRLLQDAAPLDADVIVTKTRLLIVNYIGSIYALVIEDPAVIRSFQLLFENSWTQAKKK